MILRHRSHQLAPALAAIGAAAASPALARIDPPATPAPTPREASATSEIAPVVVRTVDDGFDWGAAAIGAGGASALIVLVALGGVAHATQHRIGAAR